MNKKLRLEPVTIWQDVLRKASW